MQAALKALRSRDKLLVVRIAFLSGHDHRCGTVVKLWSTRTAEHLHDLHIGILLTATPLPAHGAFDDHEMARKIDADCESGRAAYNADMPLKKPCFNCAPVNSIKACMVKGDTGSQYPCSNVQHHGL